MEGTKKNIWIGYLLAICLGFCGGHQFYYKRYKRGFLYLLFFWTFIPFFLTIIDLFLIPGWNEKYNRGEGIEVDEASFDLSLKTITNKLTDQGTPFRPENRETSNKEKALSVFDNLKKSNKFYNEDEIILPKYKHLKADQEIIDFAQNINNQKDYGNWRVTVSTSVIEFRKQSLQYANKRGKPVKEIPFKQYYPVFNDLTPRQLQWYFYWRGEVLNQNYIDVDLSYIFIFVYELLNYSFNTNPAFIASMLERLRDNYSYRYSKFPIYINEWLSDFLYELQESHLAEEIDPAYEDSVYQKLQSNNSIDEIPISYWMNSLYNWRKSKFYEEHSADIHAEFIHQLTLITDQYNKQGKSLSEGLDLFTEHREIKSIYRGAVVDRLDSQIHVFEKRISTQGREILTNLFKYSENIVRDRKGQKRKLKVKEEMLPEEVNTQVEVEEDDRFKTVSKDTESGEGTVIPVEVPTKVDTEPEKSNVIDFDLEEIQQKEKNLTNLSSKISAYDEEEHSVPAEEIKEEPKSKTDVLDLFADSETSDEEFLELLEDSEKELLALFDNNLLDLQTANDFAKDKGMMVSVLIDEINEKGEEHLGSHIIEQIDGELEILDEFEEILESLEEIK